ncbi:MAG: ABC transporter permease [Acetobacteraceae bacterium]|nr:ABC transporter permease [Acetobacteraceae bacterium]
MLYRVDADQPRRLSTALADIRQGTASWRLAWELARLDLKNRYRGSVLGPFWITLSTLVMLVGLGFLYARLFNLPLTDYLPHLAVSLVVWQVLSTAFVEGCGTMTTNAGIIRQMRLPFSLHVLRAVLRSLIVAAHSLPLLALVFLALWRAPSAEAPQALFGLVLIAVNMASAALFLGMVCARFRDVTQIVASLMQFAFFVTPIIWKPQLLGDQAVWLPLNPFYAILETVRGPLIAGGADAAVWVAAVLYTAGFAALAVAFFARFRGRLAFWV